MTVKEYTDLHYPFRFVHADNDERVHEKVRNSPDNYDVIKVRTMWRKYIYVEVRENNKTLVCL